jgi:hypothetical protein
VLADPFVLRWNHDDDLIGHKRLLANIAMKRGAFNPQHFCDRRTRRALVSKLCKVL